MCVYFKRETSKQWVFPGLFPCFQGVELQGLPILIHPVKIWRTPWTSQRLNGLSLKQSPLKPPTLIEKKGNGTPTVLAFGFHGHPKSRPRHPSTLAHDGPSSSVVFDQLRGRACCRSGSKRCCTENSCANLSQLRFEGVATGSVGKISEFPEHKD